MKGPSTFLPKMPAKVTAFLLERPEIRELESRLDFLVLKKACFVIALLVLAALPISILIPLRIETSDRGRGELPVIPAAEPLPIYEAGMKSSAIYGAYEPAAAISVQAASGAAPLAELIKNFRLKGVVTADAPEAIIEDAASQKTLFVKTGDNLGGAAVKAIREGAVVVSSGSEEKEIRMQ